jgi:hypothetical protein
MDRSNFASAARTIPSKTPAGAMQYNEKLLLVGGASGRRREDQYARASKRTLVRSLIQIQHADDRDPALKVHQLTQSAPMMAQKVLM